VFYDVANLFSTSEYPISNSYVMGVWKIQSALVEMANGPSHFAEFCNMVSDMQAKFNKYWSEYNLALSCATTLDPRYKVTFLKSYFVKRYGSKGVGDRVEKVITTLRMSFDECMHASSNGSFQNIAHSTSCSGGKFSIDDNQAELDDWVMFVTQETAYTQMGKSELDLYLGPNHSRTEDLDILDYWFKTSARYPTLELMARGLLTIPVSTVGSESTFSIGGKTITPIRSSLKPKTVQALICLRDWMLAMEEAITFIFYDSFINIINTYDLMDISNIYRLFCSILNGLNLMVKTKRIADQVMKMIVKTWIEKMIA